MSTWRYFKVTTDDHKQLRAGRWPAPGAHMSGLLLQGRGDLMELRAPVAATLAGLGVEAISWDWRGQGSSDRDPGLAKGIGHVTAWDDYSLDLEAVLGAAALTSQPWMIAHSMGGLIALEALAQRRCEVRGLVLISPMLGFNQRVPDALIAWLAKRAVALGYGQRAAWGERYTPPQKWCFDGNMSTLDPVQFEQLREVFIAHPEPAITGSSWSWVYAATQAMRAQLEPQRLKPLRSIPVLICSAAQERSVSLAAHRALAGALPHAEHVELPGAHDLLIGSPTTQAQLWSHISRFLAQR